MNSQASFSMNYSLCPLCEIQRCCQEIFSHGFACVGWIRGGVWNVPQETPAARLCPEDQCISRAYVSGILDKFTLFCTPPLKAMHRVSLFFLSAFFQIGTLLRDLFNITCIVSELP